MRRSDGATVICSNGASFGRQDGVRPSTAITQHRAFQGRQAAQRRGLAATRGPAGVQQVPGLR